MPIFRAAMPKPSYTLIVTSWYPSKESPINGIFIKKHAQAISTFRNVKAIYALPGTGNNVEEKIESDTYSMATATYTDSGNKKLNQVRYLFALRRAYMQTVKQYSTPELVHLHVVFPAGLFVYLLFNFLNVPLLITEHWSGYTNEDGRYDKLQGFIKSVIQKLFNRAKGISAVSAYLRDAIAAKTPANAGKLMITSNILNVPDRVQLAAYSAAHIKAIFVGNLNDHEKNVSKLIDAVELIVKQYPQFEVTFVGGGDELPRYKRIAEQKDLLNKHIRFTGYIDNSEIAPLYRQHHFYILTSNFETFSISAAEAIMHGLPVVSTRCGGPADFIDESNGIWIEEKSVEGIKAAIEKMIANYSSYRRIEMGESIREKYSTEQVIEQLKKLYHISGV